MSTATRPVHETGEETVWIPIKKIEALKPDPKDRSYSKPMALALAEDFKINGQLHPIHVRPHPDPRKAEKGCYQQITGLHRIEAQRIAGSDAVLCVIRVADDAEFSAIRDAENALRANLSRDQQLRAVSRLHEFYEARLARQKDDELREKAQALVEVDENKKKASDDNKPKTRPGGKTKTSTKARKAYQPKESNDRQRDFHGFRDLVASVLGVSKRTGDRVVRCAKMVESLTPEQREVLFPAGKANNNILDKNLEALAALDGESRSKAISLAASGMTWEKAILEHTPKPELVELEGKPRPEEDYKDKEWVETFCAKILPKLKKRDIFETEAIKWREFRKIRKKAQGQVKELLDLWKNRRVPGLFEKLILQAWYVAHPNDWIPCGICGATGETQVGTPGICPACDGGAFKLKIERWE